ncbi:hypothetical protein F4814DRAFT_422707 [Daldinia grandis]|nr:hypothetical protein F4814DRAFT_422707 [Daldinia grandis]
MSSVKRRYLDLDPEEEIWERHELTFRQLYQTEHKTLKEVKEIMESEHGFPVNSLSTYEIKLRDKLHLRKKLKKPDWASVHQHRLMRGDKPTGVYLNGTEIPQEKVWKEIRRSGARLVDNGRIIPLPRDVVVRTPSPVGCLVPHALPTQPERSQGLPSQLLASPMMMPSAPPSPGALIYSPRNMAQPSQSHINSSMNHLTQRDKFTELLEVASGATATALLSIPWLSFSKSMRQMATTICRPSEHDTALDHSLSFESIPFIMDFVSELVSPETWRVLFPLHRLPIPSHTPSSSVPTLNMDIFYLLSKVFYLISNNKLQQPYEPSVGSPDIIRLFLDRIPQAVLKSLFREDLPTIRAVWQYLAGCAGRFGYRDAFRSLMGVGLLHRYWIVPRGSSYLSFAASMGALDVIRSLSKAGIRADGSIGVLEYPAIIEAAATGNIECLKLLMTTCDVNCKAKTGGSIFDFFISALHNRAIITFAKRDHAYPPNSFRRKNDDYFIIRFELENKPQSRALDMLLQSGANVDATCRRFSQRLEVEPMLCYLYPNKKHLPTILEQSYYHGDKKLFSRLAPYSTEIIRTFFRPDLCLAAKRGCEFLREYWTSQPARLDSNGTAFLEVVFAEQFFGESRAIDMEVIRNLVEFGIRLNLPSLKLNNNYFLWSIVTHVRMYGYNEHVIPIFTELLRSGAVIDSRILEAGVEEDGTGILEFLSQFGVNVRKYGVLALSTAARFSNYKAVSWLLEAGVNINGVSHYGFEPWSAIALASTTSRIQWRLGEQVFEQGPEWYQTQKTDPASFEMLDYLIDHGAQLKNSPYDLNSVEFLQRVLRYSWGDIIRGKDVSLLDLMTFFVSKLDHRDLSSPKVCLLRESAALSLPPTDFSALGRLKMSLFELFRVHGAPMPNGDILASLIYDGSLPWLIQELLKDCTNIDTYCQRRLGQHHFTPLQAAAYRGDMDLFEQLVSMGADINMPAYEHGGITALQAAASQGHIALVERLVRMGADVNAPGDEVWELTALQTACNFDAKSVTERANRIKIIRFLIMEGAGVNAHAESIYSNTPLRIAASNGDMEVAFLLIQGGADVNVPPRVSYTEPCFALDKAAFFGRLDMVQFLLSLGALSHQQGRTGYDGAIHDAEQQGHFAIADLIRQYYADDCKLLGTNIARTFFDGELSEGV